MWLVGTRPDFSFAVNELPRRVQEPTRTDELNMKRILKYLATTRNYVMGLKIDRSADAGQLDVVVDASWANASD
eukprot:13323194-Heterocapsa_arctica.AAC.1